MTSERVAEVLHVAGFFGQPASRSWAIGSIGNDLKPPACGDNVVTVPPVGVLTVEDGEDGVGFSSEPESVADVDDSVGVVGDEVAAERTKGPSTASSYSSSAASATGVARV
jgi:hypothetical protein